MAQTFRTDPETGRTVISQDNVVGRQMSGGERVDNRISDGGASVSDVRRGYESMNAPTRAGTGYMSRSEFESLSGMTDTNPYGNDGIFTRVFGIDPSKIDYTSHLGARGIENVKKMAYDRFMNPFAKVDVFGNPTMGADFAQGTTRSGVQPGDLTVFGPAAEGQTEGIGALIGNALGFNMNPTIIPGTVGSDARSQDRGIYNFEIPENMDQLVSAALRENAIEARDPAAVPEVVDREIFTTDSEERNLIEEDFEVDRRATAEDSPVFRGTVPESTYRPIFTDDVTVADVIAAAPMVTTSPVVSENRIVQTREGRIPNYNPNPAPSAPVARGSILGPATDRLRQNIDELEDTRRRTEFFQDVYDELYPAPESVSAVSPLPQSSVDGPIDLISMLPPPPVMTPTPKPSRGPTAAQLAFAAQLEADLARRKAMR